MYEGASPMLPVIRRAVWEIDCNKAYFLIGIERSVP